MKKAFTLAEVLVTLGIIGVVSAMTIPTLMNNYQRQTYVSQLSKVYNEFSQAFLQYRTDRQALNLKEAGMSSQAALNTFMTSYFKIVNRCDNTAIAPCFAAEYKKMTGAVITDGAFTLSESFVLANGASVRYLYLNDARVGNILVDVNGLKGPNVLGRDLFVISVYIDGTMDDYNGVENPPLSRAVRDSLFANQCNAAGAGVVYGCFGKILNDNWQMTY